MRSTAFHRPSRVRAIAQARPAHRLSSLVGVGLFAVLVLLVLGWSSAQAAPDPKGAVPPIESVQANMIKNMKLADFRLEGRVIVKKGKSKDKSYPIVLRTKGYIMQFEFQTQPLQIKLDLDPDNDRTQVFRRKSSKDKWTKVSGREMTRPILDTDITYEDLALDFMKWEDVKPLGTDSIKTFKTWAYRAKPNGPSQYASADYWVSSDYYAFMQVEGRNAKGQPVKRVEVSDLQEVDGVWVIKEMLTTTYKKGSKLAASRTWLYLSNAKSGASGL